MPYGFRNQLAVGAAGEEKVIEWLTGQGYDVEDQRKSRDHQRQDIDLIIAANGVSMTAEVKTDTHKSESLFIELSVDDKPGYIWKTRAEVLLYYMTASGKLYWIDVPRLCRYVYTFGNLYDLKVVTSRSGNRQWEAEGVVVPVGILKTHEVLKEYEL